MGKSRTSTILLASLMLAWIATSSLAGGNPDGAGYDLNSWKTVIPASCQSFFDGCNQCRRGKTDDTAMCTRKACQAYQRPRCADEPIIEGSAGGSPFDGRLVHFSCDGDVSLRVYYEQYVSGDQLVALAEDELMLVDEQTHTAHRLRRERAASGAKFAGEKFEFWEHGGEAMLRKNGELLYQNCKVAG